MPRCAAHPPALQWQLLDHHRRSMRLLQEAMRRTRKCAPGGGGGCAWHAAHGRRRAPAATATASDPSADRWLVQGVQKAAPPHVQRWARALLPLNSHAQTRGAAPHACRLCAIMLDALGRDVLVRREYALDKNGWPANPQQLSVSEGQKVRQAATLLRCRLLPEQAVHTPVGCFRPPRAPCLPPPAPAASPSPSSPPPLSTPMSTRTPAVCLSDNAHGHV